MMFIGYNNNLRYALYQVVFQYFAPPAQGKGFLKRPLVLQVLAGLLQLVGDRTVLGGQVVTICSVISRNHMGTMFLPKYDHHLHHSRFADMRVCHNASDCLRNLHGLMASHCHDHPPTRCRPTSLRCPSAATCIGTSVGSPKTLPPSSSGTLGRSSSLRRPFPTGADWMSISARRKVKMMRTKGREK